MYIHNIDPVLLNLGFLEIRWYSLAYIFGILGGWWLGKKIIIFRFNKSNTSFDIKIFDDLVSWLIISIIIGGRLGYVIFYNLNYYLNFPLDIFKIWEGGMSFHGGLIGVVFSTIWFASRKKFKPLFFLDVISCVAPIGLFFGRIANFINGELYGKPTSVFWAVIFPEKDSFPRHPSQLYEAFLEGIILFIILNIIIFKKNYINGMCSSLFLTFYGLLRIISEQYREPDVHIGLLLNKVSIGTALSSIMIFIGIIFFIKVNRNEFK